MRYLAGVQQIGAVLLAAVLVAALDGSEVLAAQKPGQGASGRSDGGPRLVAVSPRQNDLDPDKDPQGEVSALPAPVAAAIRRLAEGAFQAWKDCDGCGVQPADFFGPILRLRAPSRRDLYVFHLRQPLGADLYYFILYDPATRAVTPQPASIYGKWMAGDWGAPLEKPLIAFHDLDGDGREELVVQERVHNGTAYNAVIYHYFRIAPDLSLHRMLALETRLVDLYTEDQRGVILRSVERIAPDALRLTAVLTRPSAVPPAERLGEVTLRRAGPDEPYQVSARRVFNEKYRELLVSAFGEKGDDRLLREGYGFHY